MERSTRYLRALAGAALAALLVSCTAGGGAIFATIEQEEEPVESDLPDAATVTDVLPLRLAGGTQFLAAARTLFRGVQTTAGDSSTLRWTAVAGLTETPPAGGQYAAPADLFCRSAVLLAGATPEQDALLAVLTVTDAAGESTALYRATPPADFAAAAVPALEWSLATVSPGFGGGTPQSILAVGGELFVTVRLDAALPGYALYRYEPASGALTAAIAYSPVLPSDGAAHDSAFWFIAGNALYSGSLATLPLARVTDAAVSSAASYGGIHASSDGTTTSLHLSTGDGKLFLLTAAGWSAVSAVTLAGDGDPLAFTDFVSIGANAFVGTAGRGFFRLSGGLLPTDTALLAAARMPDRTFSELYTATIAGFSLLQTGSENVVFVRTSGRGLWHQVVQDDLPDRGWVWD